MLGVSSNRAFDPTDAGETLHIHISSGDCRHSRGGRYGTLLCLDIDRPRITLRHFPVSSAISLPKSAGESTSTSPPRSASRALILGSASRH
jgi:hypothetical protein